MNRKINSKRGQGPHDNPYKLCWSRQSRPKYRMKTTTNTANSI